MAALVNNFEVPNWAGKPQPGLHLDVMKESKMIQKLMVDEKKAYFFGRNKQLCDFTVDHASCSRVHSALVWHKHLNRPFLIDLGSTHGTFIGHIRLESKKPQQVPIDSEIHFGASSRIYIIRERPQGVSSNPLDLDIKDDREGKLLGLPETETEMENLTEFNTAHNRRITAMADIADTPSTKSFSRKRKNVNFGESDEVINPEDIDPSIGRFRNMIQTTVVPSKKQRMHGLANMDNASKNLHTFSNVHHHHGRNTLYSGMPDSTAVTPTSPTGGFSFSSKVGLPMPNLAPSVEDMVAPIMPAHVIGASMNTAVDVDSSEPKKKKYAKESWPGKKPGHSLL